MKTGRPKGSQDISPKVRGAFLRALKINKGRNQPLSQLIADSLVERPMETLSVMSRYLPKTLSIDVDANLTLVGVLQSISDQSRDITPHRTALPVESERIEHDSISHAIDSALDDIEPVSIPDTPDQP